MKIKKFGLVVLFSFIAFTFTPFQEVSAATSVFVKDDADILSPETEQKIIDLNENVFKEYESFPQLAVYTVEQLPEDSDIDSYTNDLFASLGVGQAEYDNGLLFVLSEQDREYRLETGYGMEYIIVDGMHSRIMTDNVGEYLSNGDFDGAISMIVDNIGNVVKKSEYGEGTALTVEERETIALERELDAEKRQKEQMNKIFKTVGSVLGAGALGGGGLLFFEKKRKKEKEEEVAKSKIEIAKNITSNKKDIHEYLLGELNKDILNNIQDNKYKYDVLNKDISYEISITEEKGLDELQSLTTEEQLGNCIMVSFAEKNIKDKKAVVTYKESLLQSFNQKNFQAFLGILSGIDTNELIGNIHSEHKELVSSQIELKFKNYLTAVDYVLSKTSDTTVDGLNNTIENCVKDIDIYGRDLSEKLILLQNNVERVNDSSVNELFKKEFIKYNKNTINLVSELLLKDISATSYTNSILEECAILFVTRTVKNSGVSQTDSSRFLDKYDSDFSDWFITLSKKDIERRYAKYHRQKENERIERRRREAAAAALAASNRSNNSSSGGGFGGGGSSFGGGSSGGGGFSGKF